MGQRLRNMLGWNHQSHDERRKWRKAITKELYCMENKKVWRIKYKTDMPNDRRLIGCKWVFKIKEMEHIEQY